MDKQKQYKINVIISSIGLILCGILEIVRCYKTFKLVLFIIPAVYILVVITSLIWLYVKLKVDISDNEDNLLKRSRIYLMFSLGFVTSQIIVAVLRLI